MAMQLTVVVCTYNRYDALPACLEALRPQAQTAPGKSYEVIVVDNTPKPARRSRRGFSCNKWVTCDEVGLSNARNAGIAAADGDIVAFVDDDAIVVPEWCQEAIAVFARHPAALAAGGKVVPEYPDGNAPVWMTAKLSEYLSCLDWGADERALRTGEWIVGTNIAFRRSVFADATLFNPGLGRKGNLGLLGNEEIALIARIGHSRVIYNPAMLVRHVISPDRLTQTWFRKRVFWQAISDQLAGIDVPALNATWREIRDLAPRLRPEHRNLNGLAADCSNADEFTVQLRQIYLVAHLLAGGMAAP